MSEIIYYRRGPQWSDGCVDKLVMHGQLEPIPALKIPEVDGLNIVRDLNQKIKTAREALRQVRVDHENKVIELPRSTHGLVCNAL